METFALCHDFISAPYYPSQIVTSNWILCLAPTETNMRKFDRFLSAAVGVLLVSLFGIMLSLSAAQIALRYFFGTGIPWGDVASWNLVLWGGLLGAVVCLFLVLASVRYIAVGLKGSGEAFLGIGVAVVVEESEARREEGTEHLGFCPVGRYTVQSSESGSDSLFCARMKY
jgi:hypothetical protein